MPSKCKECDNEDNYNFVLNIGLCDPCIEEKLERLEVENEMLREKVKFLTEYDDDIDGLQTKVKQLKKALKKYGLHTNACPRTSKHILEPIYRDKKCECGLEQALKGE